MSIDEHLHAALGYMVRDDTNVEQLVVSLFERVQDEARYATDSALIRWQGEEPLAEGWGELVVMLERIGRWDSWTIARRDIDGKLWAIMEWDALDIDIDDDTCEHDVN